MAKADAEKLAMETLRAFALLSKRGKIRGSSLAGSSNASQCAENSAAHLWLQS
ncbi:hypothetical protein [Sinorhizobium meliloti]|uniref:hypothetical protein n=1 Tax=Rhizobium meliloti TaxID=382 RepID=UPI0012BB638A|nr:hypothetical protein [Sinorhizobium meliloti]MDX0110354.1 hypothetical protein [Sinorhizobium meliloti]UFX13115.1 hypothetical protein SmelRRI128_34800 [Sinorhizobium meliloti]